MSNANQERTFLMIKPDDVQCGLIGEIIQRFESKDHVDRPFFPSLIEYMKMGPIVPMVLQGLNVVLNLQWTKNLCNDIRIANNIMMIGLGDEVNPQEIKQLKNHYYRLSNVIIEKGSLTKDEETNFDNWKHTIDKLARIGNTITILRKGLERLERHEATEYDKNLINRKLDDMRMMASDNPSIEDSLIEMERQFERLTTKNANNESTSTFNSTTKHQGATSSGNNENGTTGDSIPQFQPLTSHYTTNNGQPETNNMIPTGTTYYPYQQYWWDYGNYHARSGAKRVKHYDGDPIGYPVFRQTIKHYLIDNHQIRENLNKLMEIRDLLPDKHQYILEQRRRQDLIQGGAFAFIFFSGVHVHLLAPPAGAHVLERVDQVNPDMNDVLKTLDNHYGGRSRIIPALKARIRSTSKLPLRPSEREWESMTETVILIRNTLKTTGLEAEEFSLISPIMAKIDRIHFMNIGDDEEVTLAQIESYLKHDWNRERTIGSQIDPDDIASTNQTRVSNATSGRMRSNVMAATSKSTCMFRDGDHRTADCTLNAEQRKEAVIEHRLCFRCGESNHQSRECNRDFRCMKCGKNHLTFLCRDYKQSSKSFDSQETKSTNENTQTLSNQIDLSTNETTALLTTNEKSIHKTMTTMINDKKVRILFDGGAGISFISNQLVEQLKLDVVKVEPIRVKTLYDSTSTSSDKCAMLRMPTWNVLHDHDIYNNMKSTTNKSVTTYCTNEDDQNNVDNRRCLIKFPSIAKEDIYSNHVAAKTFNTNIVRRINHENNQQMLKCSCQLKFIEELMHSPKSVYDLNRRCNNDHLRISLPKLNANESFIKQTSKEFFSSVYKFIVSKSFTFHRFFFKQFTDHFNVWISINVNNNEIGIARDVSNRIILPKLHRFKINEISNVVKANVLISITDSFLLFLNYDLLTIDLNWKWYYDVWVELID
ncbi:hypothetical protein DERF_009819 [Dermatophagoides farinae]|uniref:CCHC-type domain-containing protein n=1 Tax=Dermatophagoides farinae TaxID=6954 RepID=A0A922HVR2_DERFA|nr:hypothetical protein DERF_009819 [Dermatophagoides farinae]